MICMKIYKHGDELLISACDENILGKYFKEGKFRLRVKKKFYDGIRVNAETLKEYLKKATIANLVGEETVNCAIEAGIVDPDCVIRIQNVPHAQMVRML